MSEGNGHLIGQYTATREQLDEYAHGDHEEEDILVGREQSRQIQARESDYQKKRFNRTLDDGAAPGESYKEIMQRRELEKEEARVQKMIADKAAAMDVDENDDTPKIEYKPTLKEEPTDDANGHTAPPRKRRRRWEDVEPEAEAETVKTEEPAPVIKKSKWDSAEDGTAVVVAPKKKSRFDSAVGSEKSVVKTETNGDGGAAQQAPLNLDLRYGPLLDEALDLLLPGKDDGYEVLPFPPGREPAIVRAGGMPPLPSSLQGGFMMQQSVDPKMMGVDLPSDLPGIGDLPMKQEDMQYFGKLVDGADENEMTVEELKERKIMRLLIKVKNGTPPMRKTALRQLTDNARTFGAAALFDQILPLMMEKSLEDQERHLLVKVIDRILYKLDDLVRPYTHKILVVIQPLLIDQDYYARVEGREIISNLAKAAGLAHMISTMRPDVDHPDEYVRNTTSRAFAVVASALGIPALLPFLRAVCRSKKSWEARHTGLKIVQQIPIMMGCAVLPHLNGLVDCLEEGLNDDQLKVRTVAALAIAALAEASNPYGIESFDKILHPLWQGARKQRGKALAAYLKAVGFLIPLMDEEYANYYVSEIMQILRREFQTPDEEMKKVVLKVLSQCANTHGVTGAFLRDTVINDFFKFLWTRRMSTDRRNYAALVETVTDLAKKCGVEIILDKIVDLLKDEAETFREMTMETIEKVVTTMGVADIDERMEERLVDGILVAFQEQSMEQPVILNGFGAIVNALDVRCKPYLPQIVTSIFYRLQDKSPSRRQQASDLISRIAITMQHCEEDALMGKLGVALYENLGEEYPEVLGSHLGALRSIVSVVGISQMQPPIRDLLPRLTPILRNRHEKVQENAIDLVGRIADRGPESIHAKEWMRICFELLDMLKAHKKGIRRATNNTFGFIAKAIGPSDVLATLLNNLRISERQSRVCTAVAIGIVAETCAPFTVLPALMNEYRVPELNVQNGVLKALSFLFEYIGEMGKDYVYAVVPLIEDALIDRDQVHRQTAAAAVKHVALGVVGLGCEDAMLHLLNLVWPNIFETSPHVIDRMIEAIDALRVAVGTGTVANYLWAGLFHPARKVRTPYWRVWNDAYVMSADAFVPYYPKLDLEVGQEPRRIAGEELMAFF